MPRGDMMKMSPGRSSFRHRVSGFRCSSAAMQPEAVTCFSWLVPVFGNYSPERISFPKQSPSMMRSESSFCFVFFGRICWIVEFKHIFWVFPCDLLFSTFSIFVFAFFNFSSQNFNVIRFSGLIFLLVWNLLFSTLTSFAFSCLNFSSQYLIFV